MLPIIADGEAGFGGPLNVFELTKKFIRAGAAGVHFEDQLASEKNVVIWVEKFCSNWYNGQKFKSCKISC